MKYISCLMKEKEQYKDDVSIITEGEDCKVFQIQNETGEGIMKSYCVFPGVSLMYNDFHMKSCESNFKIDVDSLCIDHCREGRIEHEIRKGVYSYLGAGDLKIDPRIHHSGHVEFPFNHYHGISIFFNLEEASKALPLEIRDFPVDLYEIQKKYCDDKSPFIIKSYPSIEHIFSEIYAVPQKIKKAYFKIKILELLLYLDALELPSNCEEQPYFYKTQVEKIKAIHSLMTENLNKHYTLNQLSNEFDIPLTSMKICFKNVYGNSIFAYMRFYRINLGAVLLRQNKEYSIAEIAGKVGYDSPSKFSTAFKDVMGVSPIIYRKNSI